MKKVIAMLMAALLCVSIMPVVLAEETRENLALGKTPISSKDSHEKYPPKLMFDGNSTTRWSALVVDNTNEWVGVNLGAVYYIDQVMLEEYKARVTEYRIEYSLDNIEWKTAYTGFQTAAETLPGGNLNKWDPIEFEPVKAQFIRVYAVKCAAKGISFWEFKVFGSDSENRDTFDEDVASVTPESLLGANLDAQQIRENLVLPPTPLPGRTKVTWTSDNEDVIATTGTVNRTFTGKKNVTMTAHFSSPYGSYTHDEPFVFTVIGISALEIDWESVTYESLTMQNPEEITENLADLETIAAHLPGGSSLNWTSDRPDIISEKGIVSRDPDDHIIVTLTAEFSNNNEKIEKQFVFTVLAKGRELAGNLMLDEQTRIAADENPAYPLSNLTDTRFTTKWLLPEEADLSLTVDFGKPTSFSTIILREASGDGTYLVKKAVLETSSDGVNFKTIAELEGIGESRVVQPILQNKRYLRYSVLEKEPGSTGLNELEVYWTPSDLKIVEADKAGFQWNGRVVVTENLDLPQNGDFGSIIEWTSSDESVISSGGVVTRKADQQLVTMKYRFIYGSASHEGGGILFTVPGTGSSNVRPPSGGSSGGSKSDSSGNGVVSYIPPASQREPSPSEQEDSVFKDVSTERWSYPYIKKLYDLGVLSGDEEGAFHPEQPLSREQFVKMMVELLEIPVTAEASGFDDVPEDAWFSGYVAAAKQAGIVNGIGGAVFGVGQPVSRQDAAVMICKAMNAVGKPLEITEPSGSFTDQNDIAPYALESVQILSAGGILNGTDGAFCPNDDTLREQGAKILCQLFAKIQE